MNQELLRLLPRWARSPWALTFVLLLVAVPVGVSLLRDSDYSLSLEVFPTHPAGNADVADGAGLLVDRAVANPGFQAGAGGWDGGPGVVIGRTTDEAHSGAASLATADPSAMAIKRAASTTVRFPAPGRYRLRTWVRLPSGYRGGAPRVDLAESPGSARLAARAGDPQVTGGWQQVWSDHVVRRRGLRGRLVLGTTSAAPARSRQVLHWDDVQVLSADPRVPLPARANAVPNPSFTKDRSGWGDPPAVGVRWSAGPGHFSPGSLRSAGVGRAGADTNAGFTHVVLPRAGIYRVDAWVRLPPPARTGAPSVALEGFSESTLLTQRVGRPSRRGAWQPVSAEYAVSSLDLEGSLVLRVPPASAGSIPRATTALWDDVSVKVPRGASTREAAAEADLLRTTLREPQLRFDVATLAGDDDLYDPRRISVQRGSRRGVTSFVLRVEDDVPDDARRLAEPLTLALGQAAKRAALRRASEAWASLVTDAGRGLLPPQRDLLQRRARIVDRLIGAPALAAVTTPVPGPAPPEPGPAAVRAQREAQRERQRAIARIGSDLLPRQEALVRQRLDDLQRLVATQPSDFLVRPPDTFPEARRWVDRTLDELPGPFPPRVDLVWAGLTGLLCALLLLAASMVVTAVRLRHAAPRV